MPTKRMKERSTLLVIREMPIKTPMRGHLKLSRMAIFKMTDTPNAGGNVGEGAHTHTAHGGGGGSMVPLLWSTL